MVDFFFGRVCDSSISHSFSELCILVVSVVKIMHVIFLGSATPCKRSLFFESLMCEIVICKSFTLN